MRVALTGGATGIGAVVAEKLKKRGDEVIAFDLNEPTDFVDQWIEVDMGDPDSIAKAALTAQGPFDALINNAGIPPREGMSAAILNVNFIGLRHFMVAMIDKLAAGSAIVNTASRAGSQWRENIDEVKALMALGSADDLTRFVTERNIDPTRAYNLSKEAVVVSTMAETDDGNS